MCQNHYADKEAGSRLVAGGSSPSTAPFLACGHFFDDQRKTCKTCQKHYAGKDAVASASRVSMSAPAHPATTSAGYRALLCGHTQFQKECMVCVERQARVNRIKSAASEKHLQRSVTPVTEDDAMSEVDWSDDQSTPAVPSRKRSSPFDVEEAKRSSPFDAQEKQTASVAGAETFEVEEGECQDAGSGTVSTNLWANYKPIFASRHVNRPEELS